MTVLESTFTAASLLEPISPIVVGALTTYKFSVTPKNTIPKATGQLYVTFPSSGNPSVVLSANASVCGASIAGTGIKCSVGSQILTISRTDIDIAAGVAIEIVVDAEVRSPQIGKPSAAF
jgi:hypothetical protein